MSVGVIRLIGEMNRERLDGINYERKKKHWKEKGVLDARPNMHFRAQSPPAKQKFKGELKSPDSKVYPKLLAKKNVVNLY